MVAHELSPAGRFQKILLATDGSDYSAGAERIAIAMAAKSGARLLAITILPDPADGVAPEANADKRKGAEVILDKVAKAAAAAGIKCDVNVRYGADPYQAIVKESKDSVADVIVMGRRGRRGLARVMLGDATAKVMGYAPCSTLVVPEASGMWGRVLVATDGSRSSDEACVAAARIAHCCDSPLDVLSVMVPSHSDARQAEARQIVDRVVTALRKDNLAVEGIVDRGIAEDVILETAAKRKAGLIVLGSHGRTGLGRILFGSKAERVINRATCPVLVVKGA
ncbi:MAG: universal stress protein [Alphaproteobacteria bacterium]|nr:universal stress protein [Alphaproteobacteria bacterium]